MLRSMTGFAREEADTPLGRCYWELRSVNHRYLDVSVRLPEELRGLEPAVRERVGNALRRGKVECGLRVQGENTLSAPIRLNLELAGQVAQAARAVRDLLEAPAPVSPLDILRWPGVLETPQIDLDSLGSLLLAQLDRTLARLLAHREREGEQIAALLRERCAAIAEEVRQVRDILPELMQAQRDKLRARLEDAVQTLDSQRLEQEMVIFAQKMDVAEELDRLDAHLVEIRQALQAAEPVGRRLDFLMQELNREANTLGSKSVHSRTTLASVNLKVLIEQMREQIQNVE